MFSLTDNHSTEFSTTTESLSLAAAVSLLSLSEPEQAQLLDYLAQYQLATLADVRATPTLLAATQESDLFPRVKQVVALARFEVISTDGSIASQTVRMGIEGPEQLIRQFSKASFTAIFADNPAKYTAANLLYEQAQLAGSMVKALRIRPGRVSSSSIVPANFSVQKTGASLLTAATSAVSTAATNDEETTCGCAACRSAVGPTSYLAALLTYATEQFRLVSGTTEGSITAEDLQRKLHQPFCALPIACETTSVPVCKFRLATEVLRQQVGANAQSHLQPYLQSAYSELLAAFGTSADELQSAQLDDAIAEALAQRLGISADFLSNLQLHAQAATPAQNLSETRLEELFGLASTDVATRNPLSGGLVAVKLAAGSTDLVVQVNQWALSGVSWFENIDLSGKLYGYLTLEDGKTVLRLSRSNDAADATATVARAILQAADGNRYGVLQPQGEAGVLGSISLKMSSYTTQAHAAVQLIFTVVPEVVAERLRALEQQWRGQDRVLPLMLQDWNGLGFVIDPEVMGPDDIRPVNAQGRPSLAFYVWTKRHQLLTQAFVDSTDTVAELLNALASQPLTYNGTTGAVSKTTWPTATDGVASLLAMASKLASQNPALVAEAEAQAAAWGLLPLAVLRLRELYQQELFSSQPDAGALMEARQLVRGSIKKAFAETWAAEERAKELLLQGENYQQSLTEPAEEDEQVNPVQVAAPGLAGSIPLVDPDVLSPLQLPDAGFGDAAHELWKTRREHLALKRQELLSITGDGTAQGRADAMYQRAIRASVTPVPAEEPATYTYPESLAAAYTTPAAADHLTTVAYVEQTLGLTASEFARLLRLREEVATSSQTPAEATWAEMAAILTQGWKRAVAYQHEYILSNLTAPPATAQLGWVQKESAVFAALESSYKSTFAAQGLAGFVPDFNTLFRKQQFAPGRNLQALRGRWVEALAQAFQRPVVDPDQLLPSDFHQAGQHKPGTDVYQNPAYDLFVARNQQVLAWAMALEANWASVEAVLKTSRASLEKLYQDLEDGGEVEQPLRRLNLTVDGLRMLIGHLNNNTSEAHEVVDLLTQVRRVRYYAVWQREEYAQTFNNSPRYFREPSDTEPAIWQTLNQTGLYYRETEALATETSHLAWRTSPTDRAHWRQQLRARYAQAREMQENWRYAVQEVEDRTMPILRDRLIDKLVTTGVSGATAADKRQWLAERFYLDFNLTCCQNTTRVGQAIEVLQKLFFEHRHGLLNPATQLKLVSEPEKFAQDWQWLSSYERWRSLMYLYLYPENMLLPVLAPQQTGAFQDIVRAVREQGRLSPPQALAHLEQYAAFLTTISDISLASSVQTSLSVRWEGGDVLSLDSPQSVTIQVGLTRQGEIYWNLNQLTSTSANTDWQQVPTRRGVPVKHVAGTHVYKNGEQRYAQVFFLTSEDIRVAATSTTTATAQTLEMQRLNLQTLQWDEQPTRLELPEVNTIEARSLTLAHGSNELLAPILLGLRQRQPVLHSYYDREANIRLADVPMSDALGHPLNSVTLFWASLDLAGLQLGVRGESTISWFNDLQLLSALRVSADTLSVSLALRLDPTNADYVLRSFTGTLQSWPKVLADRTVLDTEEDANGELTYLYLGPGMPESTTGSSTGPQPQAFSATTSASLVDDGTGGTYWTGAHYARQTISNALIGNLVVNLGKIRHNGTAADLALDDFRAAVGIRIRSILPGNDNYTSHVNDTFSLYLNQVNTAGPTKLFDFKVLPLPVTGDWRSHAFVEFVAPSGGAGLELRPVSAEVDSYYRYVGPAFKHTNQPLVATTANQATLLPLLVTQQGTTTIRIVAGTTTLHTRLTQLPPLAPPLTGLATEDRKTKLAALLPDSMAPGSVVNYLREAYYALPMLLATELQRGRHFEEALRYYRLVYDFLQPEPSNRMVYRPITFQPDEMPTSPAVLAWLADPTNPHLLAAVRPGTDYYYVVTSLVRCLLSYADEEFARDSGESVARATSLYETALRLLEEEVLGPEGTSCSDMLQAVEALISLPWQAAWETFKARLLAVPEDHFVKFMLNEVSLSFTSDKGLVKLFKSDHMTWEVRFREAWTTLNRELATRTGRYERLCDAAPTTEGLATEDAATQQLLTDLSNLQAQGVTFIQPYVPELDARFCVPANSLPTSLRLQAQLNLTKIRSCRNIAGVQRELEPYALTYAAGTGPLERRASRVVVPPVQYRYSYLLERARQLVGLAQQAEGALLSALEKRDAEEYNLLKARQDIGVSRATVRLQDLRTVEAANGIDLASLQLQRSQTMEQQYSQWINAGLNSYEQKMMKNIRIAGAASAAQSVLQGSASALASFSLLKPIGYAASTLNFFAGVAGAVAANANMYAQLNQHQATFERRNEEWKFQRNLARKDVAIGNQQVLLARNRLQITQQEKAVSELQLSNAEAVLNFLTTKFTNAELYDWMSQILESAYSYFLQQATATARLAQQQLAFERQEMVGNLIQEDYWTAPGPATPAGTAPDRKGLTGSTRLLEDLTRLDQYAFETNRRKLQLTKTVSLAQLFPAEFARFRETGVLPFALLQRQFDQDFPGHYLRTIRRVRTSVIALVPPTEGVKARLTATGISRVVVPGPPFQTVTLIRQPEVVALTAPLNATGLFELEQQPSELLYPFEGMGVESAWSFSLQKAANPFDFNSIADVLLTLDYTAYESPDYRSQVMQQLGTRRQQVLTISLRNQFADQWYDLHHPSDGTEPYAARFTLTPEDLPRHLRNARLTAISVYVAVADEAQENDHSALGLRVGRAHFPPQAVLTNRFGLVSTRSGAGRTGGIYNGNAVALLPLLGNEPAGEWVIRLGEEPGNRLRRLFDEGLVADLVLLLEVEGEMPAYALE